MSPIFLVLTSVALSVVGQLVLKAGVGRLGVLQLGGGAAFLAARRLLTAPLIWTGLIIFGFGTFFWLAALSRVELSYAYPFLSLSYVLILISSWLFLHERIAPTRILAVVAICIGITAIAGG